MLKEEIIANKGYAVFCVKEKDQVDGIAVQILRQDCPDFLLPFKTMSIDGEMEFRYELADGVRMSYQLPKMTKKELIQQMVGLLLPFKNCGDWLLDYHCLLLDPQYIFINSKDKTVRYIYLPTHSDRVSDKEIKDFFIKFVLRVELQDDREFILQILRLLQNEDTSLITALEFFQSEIGAGSAPVRPQPASQRAGAYGYARQEEGPEIERPKAKPEIHMPEIHMPEIHMPEVLNPLLNKRESVEKPAENMFEKTAGQDAAAAASVNRFGKSNTEEQLLQKLYGNEGTETKRERKKREKQEKKEKAIEKRKEKQAASQENKKGLLGGLFGKKKNKKDERKESVTNVETAAGTGGIPIYPEPPKPVYKEASDYRKETQEMAMEDVTEMAGDDYQESDRTVIHLRLENGGGYTAPRDIELDIKKGYITIGRYDKSGYPCADYNFDHSLTFVSRNHFRIEVHEDGYRIIDLDSKNGTLLNGQELVKNMAYSLKSGDTISLSKKVRMTYRVL